MERHRGPGEMENVGTTAKVVSGGGEQGLVAQKAWYGRHPALEKTSQVCLLMLERTQHHPNLSQQHLQAMSSTYTPALSPMIG